MLPFQVFSSVFEFSLERAKGNQSTMFTRKAAALTTALIIFGSSPAGALPIKEFRKFSRDDQATYTTAAVSMLAYSYAASGNTAKAHCIQQWYFGKAGVETPGPREIAIEMGVAENLDAAKYHVEGVILGVTDKACPATQR
jgi:hypothetical protein